MEAAKLTRIPSMRELLEDTLSGHRNDLVSLVSRYVAQGKGILKPHHLLDELDNIVADDQGQKSLRDGSFGEVLKCAPGSNSVASICGYCSPTRPGVWEYVRVNVFELSVDQLTVSEYLKFKEELVHGETEGAFVLELDFEPFNASFPRPNRSSLIGNGVQFLNRRLSSNMFRNKESLEPLLDFLRVHRYKGHTLNWLITHIFCFATYAKGDDI